MGDSDFLFSGEFVDSLEGNKSNLIKYFVEL